MSPHHTIRVISGYHGLNHRGGSDRGRREAVAIVEVGQPAGGVSRLPAWLCPDTRATVADGTAESIPLTTSSIDTVLAGSAWHWFNQSQALADCLSWALRRSARGPALVRALTTALDRHASRFRTIVQAKSADVDL
jgi:hypothetical protein